MQRTTTPALFAASGDTLPFPRIAADEPGVHTMGELMPQLLSRYFGPQVAAERTENGTAATLVKAMAG